MKKKCSILSLALTAIMIVFVSSACALSPAGVELVREYRGGVLDLTHHGHIVVVDEDSNVILSVGDPEAIVFYRSISKPFQALPTLTRKLHEKYKLTERETTIFSASHSGQAFHIEALEGILEKAGLREEDFVMNPTFPGNRAADIARIEAGLPMRKLFHNCSGKHSSLMLLQRELGGEITDYWKPGSLADIEVIKAMKAVAETDNFEFGVDGCGVPVFATPMKNIAITFKNFVRPHKIRDEALAAAAEDYMPRIHKHPEMIGGTGTLCERMNLDPNIVAKSGANAAYSFAFKKEGIGVAVKITDAQDRLPLIVLEILRQLNQLELIQLNPETEARLVAAGQHILRNDNDTEVGYREAVFKLAPVAEPSVNK